MVITVTSVLTYLCDYPISSTRAIMYSFMASAKMAHTAIYETQNEERDTQPKES